jgi:CRISPR-associated protein, Cas1 family
MGKILYIFRSGKLERKDNTLRLVSEDGERQIPITTVSEIKIFGELDLNKRLLEFLNKHQIPLHFFNHYGFYVGSFYPRKSLNSGKMIIKQAEHYLDWDKRIFLAKSFLRGGVTNILKNLRYYDRRGKQGLDGLINYINLKFDEIDNISDIPNLMRLEGEIRKAYYGSFEIILEGFPFERRTKRPPQNPLNAMISFGNSLLYTTILSEIYRTHLDPRIGYLHESNQRSFSLNLDIAEVFKPVIVDRTIFSLVNKKQIDEKHFVKEIGFSHLTEKGMEIFVKAFEEKLNTTIKYKNLGKVSYRKLLRLECYKLYKHFLGEEIYKPFTSDW